MAPVDEIEGNLHHAPLVLAKFCVFIYSITNLRVLLTSSLITDYCNPDFFGWAFKQADENSFEI